MRKVKSIVLILVAAFAAVGLSSCASKAKCTCPNFRDFRSITGNAAPQAGDVKSETARL
jgi:hypothetical protein